MRELSEVMVMLYTLTEIWVIHMYALVKTQQMVRLVHLCVHTFYILKKELSKSVWSPRLCSRDAGKATILSMLWGS